jgi:hypothetical protein
MPQIAPNQYDLQGPAVSVSYSTTSLAGQPQLSYKKGRQTLHFSGSQIGVLETPIGSLVTVTIANIPDESTTTFSILLPAIDLAKETTRQSFRTIGITTVHKTTIAGPPKGTQETYKVVALRGAARRVQFLKQTAAGA